MGEKGRKKKKRKGRKCELKKEEKVIVVEW